MPLDEQDREVIEAFRRYIEDSTGNDDRYGAAYRDDWEDETTLATCFEPVRSCRFEVAVRPLDPQIRVGFFTNDRATGEEIEEAIRESGEAMEQFLGAAFREAGLDWNKPPVEFSREDDETVSFATPLALDELFDLERSEVRSKTLRMLEGYLIAFGPAIVDEEEEAEDDEG